MFRTRTHKYKWNGFFVESGKMLVRVWQDDQGLVDETILNAGDFTQVKPGKVHQFEVHRALGGLP